MDANDRKELEMLRELVGVRADARACAADAQHWLKLMAAWDRSLRLERENAKLREALGWAMARIDARAPHHASEGDGELYRFAEAKGLLRCVSLPLREGNLRIEHPAGRPLSEWQTA